MFSAEINPRSADHVDKVTIITCYQVFALYLLENVAKVRVLVLFTHHLLFVAPGCISCFTQLLIELNLKRFMLIEPIVLRYLIEVCLLRSFLLTGLFTSEFLTNPD